MGVVSSFHVAVEVDLNGKPMPWLWVTLLPFLDEKRLLHELNERESLLTEEEKKRNAFGPGKDFTRINHLIFSSRCLFT